MSARSFRSVFMVASCAGAALGCYLVSLRVASERAALEEVETRIVLAQRDIRLLQTEIGTRGRLAQLERWNVRVLALSAPSADQFLEGGFQLARLGRPEPTPAVEAPIVLASAPAPHPQPSPLEEGDRSSAGAGASVPAAARLMRDASLKMPVRDAVERAKPSPEPFMGKFVRPTAKDMKTGDKKTEMAAKSVTSPVPLAKVDPLAPLPAKPSSKTRKETASAQ
jgi:hypothetical protein